MKSFTVTRHFFVHSTTIYSNVYNALKDHDSDSDKESPNPDGGMKKKEPRYSGGNLKDAWKEKAKKKKTKKPRKKDKDSSNSPAPVLEDFGISSSPTEQDNNLGEGVCDDEVTGEIDWADTPSPVVIQQRGISNNFIYFCSLLKYFCSSRAYPIPFNVIIYSSTPFSSTS
jgi:hypothetical protein